MKAAVYRRYGPPDVLRMEEVEKPAPKTNELLIRVHASTVCAADWRMRSAYPFLIRLMNGLWRPKKTLVLGIEFAGTVEAAGSAVTRFSLGDQVFGATGFRFGAHAEYVCVAEDGTVATKPRNMPLDESAAVFFGGFSALHFLRKAHIGPRQSVLIYGASGSVGVFAVQLAKHFGACVTGVCSTVNLEMVRGLGADKVVDYTREDFSRTGAVYDIVFDTVGLSGFARSLRCLKRGGFYIRCGASGGMLPIVGGMVRGMWVNLTSSARVISSMAKGSVEDVGFFKQLIEDGKVRTVIDKRYALEEIAEAHRHAEGGHKKGHVLVMVEKMV